MCSAVVRWQKLRRFSIRKLGETRESLGGAAALQRPPLYLRSGAGPEPAAALAVTRRKPCSALVILFTPPCAVCRARIERPLRPYGSLASRPWNWTLATTRLSKRASRKCSRRPARSMCWSTTPASGPTDPFPDTQRRPDRGRRPLRLSFQKGLTDHGNATDGRNATDGFRDAGSDPQKRARVHQGAGCPHGHRGDHRGRQARAVVDEHPALAYPCPDRRAAGTTAPPQHGGDDRGRQAQEIGRASCRERV